MKDLLPNCTMKDTDGFPTRGPLRAAQGEQRVRPPLSQWTGHRGLLSLPSLTMPSPASGAQAHTWPGAPPLPTHPERVLVLVLRPLLLDSACPPALCPSSPLDLLHSMGPSHPKMYETHELVPASSLEGRQNDSRASVIYAPSAPSSGMKGKRTHLHLPEEQVRKAWVSKRHDFISRYKEPRQDKEEN